MKTLFNLNQKEPIQVAQATNSRKPIFEEMEMGSCIDLSSPNYQNNHRTNNDSLSKLTNVAMNQLSYQNDSTVKNYLIGSFYDEKTKSWTQKFTESNTDDGPNLINEMKEKSTSSTKKTAIRWAAATILLVLFAILGAFAQADIRIGKLVSNDKPVIGNTVTYTLYAVNEGTSAATNVVIKDNFPTSGATPTLAGIVAGSGTTFDTSTFEWSIPSLAAGDSVAVTIPAKVIAQGVYFNTAEVKAMTGSDVDSTPNNSSLVEDDFAAACFSVPLYWYVGDEYTVSVPAPYKYGATIKWFRNGVEVVSSTPEAVVNTDTSLTIKKPGIYTFTTNVSTCPAQGCCAVEIIQGPYGSIGDFVWQDTDNDGIQDPTETGVQGVTVELYKVDGLGNPIGAPIQTVQTASNGKYLFDSLFTDTYKVKIITSALPDTLKLTNKVDLGGDDTKDSDFDSVSGLSPPIAIYVDSTGLKKDNLTIDAGLFVPVGTIGDYVWVDADNDGFQDPTETGVQGVILELYAADASGNPIGSLLGKDTTDANGFYEFINLKKGDYVVKVVTSSIPTAYSISKKPNAGGDDTKDSDFTAAGLSPKVTLNPGDETNPLNKNNPTIDLAIVSLGTIGDYVWNDTDNDGIQDGGESGIAGVQVELYAADASGNPVGAALAKDTTDANGLYQFKDLIKGDYVVKIITSTIPTGFIISNQTNAGGDDTKDSDFSPSTGLSQKISLDPTNTGGDPLKKDNPTVDAGLFSPLGSIGDFVWKDTDNDGVQDPGELGAEGVVIELYASDSNGNPIGAAFKKDTTDANGAYLFTNLPAGDYVIKVVSGTLPTNFEISTLPNAGSDDTKDSDVNPTNGLSPKITITTINPANPTDKDNTTVDIALYTPVGVIGDYVWKDADNDGIQDSGEAGVPGVILELYAADANGNPTGAVLKKDTTDANGFYQFTDVLKGEYVVKIVQSSIPADSKLSAKENIGGDDTKDNDFGTDGLSQKISFDPTNTTDPLLKNNPTIDAAIITTGSIGDYVWKDSDNDG
ncbi:MAG: hypothetical protein MUF45_15600, partial [Spirosomaceae bacterium]|nr:hypothetical protein [Spirosomataceae bacterium]